MGYDFYGSASPSLPQCNSTHSPTLLAILITYVLVLLHKTIILPVALTLREEYRMRVFENRVLRRIFGPKRDEMTGDWRKLHN
jgi:uncharacterized membrane protein